MPVCAPHRTSVDVIEELLRQKDLDRAELPSVEFEGMLALDVLALQILSEDQKRHARKRALG